MSFAPYIAIWVVLVAAAGLCWPASRRPRLLNAVILTSPLLALAIWFIFRSETAVRSMVIADRSFAVGPVAWQLTGVVLLHLLAGAVAIAISPEPGRAAWRPLLLFALATVALPVVWAADDRTRVLSLALFAVVWGATLWFARLPGKEAAGSVLRPLLWLGAALFLLWLAAITPTTRAALTLLAAALFLGVWPLGGWRAGARARRPEMSGVLLGLPVVGAAVLSPLLSETLPLPALATATALGLLSLVAGLLHAWARTPGGLAAALGMALAGLALVAAVWAGEEGLAAAARLAVFAPAALALLPKVESRQPRAEIGADRARRIAPATIALAVIYLAVGGTPLTAGFVVLSRLYDSWRFSGGFILILVAAALVALWLAAVYLAGRSLFGASGPNDRAAWLRGLALLVPLLALISLNFSAPAGGALTWIAIAAPLAAGLLLGRFAPDPETLNSLLRESVAVRLPVERIAPRLRGYGHAVGEAVADALAILEGEYGLLWLLALLLLLFWLA
jgi:hypothetical protein